MDCGERIVGAGVEAWEGEGDVPEERRVESMSAGMETGRRRGWLLVWGVLCGQGWEMGGEWGGRCVRQKSVGVAKRPPPALLKTREMSSAESATRGPRMSWQQGFRIPSGARSCMCTRLSFISWVGNMEM